MKCPNCGAEIKDTNKFCDFCGAQITLEMKKEQEQLNKAGCPKCGSSNVTFNREKQGELKGKKGTAVVRSTVGLCKDCGYTWQAEDTIQKKKKNTWLWVLGWICLFPVPLTILLLRKKDMDSKLKYGIIAAAWIVYLIIGLSGQSNNSTGSSSSAASTEASSMSQELPSEPEADSVATQKEPEKTTADTEKSADLPSTNEASSDTISDEKDDKQNSDSDDAADIAATLGEKNALNQAKNYLAFTAFSAKGLKEQLAFEGYSEEEALFGVENCGADWSEQALKKAQEYLNTTAFSAKGLKEQLAFEGFTDEEASYGVEGCGADWKEQAAKKAQEYLNTMEFSASSLKEQLKFEGFSDEEADYGIQAVGY